MHLRFVHLLAHYYLFAKKTINIVHAIYEFLSICALGHPA